MTYSSTEKKRFRRSFSQYSHWAEIPSLLKLQRDSYHDFLQKEVPAEKRRDFGLQAAFHNVFPIYSSSGAISLEFGGYQLEEPQYDERECKERNLTYRSSVKADIKMIVREKKGGEISSIREETIYMGELPMMTAHGSFIVNGTERVVVSQLHRSPGVFFEHDAGRSGQSKRIYSARVIPYNGHWLDFEFDQRDIVYFRIDRRRKMPATILLKAIGYTDEEILDNFYEFDMFKLGAGHNEVTYRLKSEFLEKEWLPFDLKTSRNAVIVPAGQRIKKSHLEKIAKLPEDYPVDDSFLLGKRLAKNIVSADGEVVAKANAELNEETLVNIRAAGVSELETLHINELNRGAYIAETLALGEKLDRELSRNAIYRMLRPGDPPSPDVVNAYLDGLFFSNVMYDMSRVGRMKFNRRLAPGRPSMEHRIWIRRDTLSSKRVLREAAENLVEAGCMPNSEEAEALLNYIVQSESRAVDRLTVDETELRARSVFNFSFVAENLTIEEAEALSAKLTKLPHEILEQTILSRKDVMSVVLRLVDLRNGKGKTDDIDSMTNRRVRTVGEFVANHFEQGLRRVDRAIRDRLSRADTGKGLMPHELVSAKAISGSVAEFFNGNQLSQFMDQTNSLSEITHKRRVSAFGAGGLTRDRVGFEVRDVHPTHYGRICPVETPEGQNIGLINSMAMYSAVDEYGFLQTRYREVKNGKIGDKELLLSAIEEEGKIIAQASVKRDGGKIADEMLLARKDGEYLMVSAKEVDYIDVSPAQISSAAASMIPFLEHDDANRALMGSNMQRQAVPSVTAEKPLVGTGVERRLAADSGAVICARRAGQVFYVDADRIVVGVDAEDGEDIDVDIYSLTKHVRSNQNTDINQRTIVRNGDKVAVGDILADGTGTDLGELSLGQNLLVAFMPWNGFNFEDSILISERVVAEQRFASIHIIEEIAHARGTPLGDEEVTRDIPHQSERALRNLDEEGIIRIGVDVHPGDILVGKVTPKGERQMSPEEKLLQAVFGDKANDFKDTSMRMPPGGGGVVIDVKVFVTPEDEKIKCRKCGHIFTRTEKIKADRANERKCSKCEDISPGGEKSRRAAAVIEDELRRYKNARRDELAFIKQDAARRILALTAGHNKKGETEKLSQTEALKLRTGDAAIDERIEKIVEKFTQFEAKQRTRTRETERKLYDGHDLAQGILKTVKVYVAIKRNLQVGDKMAGRHGNKGVVSKVEPVESMPYMDDGTPVDIVLNPLGVPSRMNVGQILETHLGFAARGLGIKIEALLRDERKKSVAELRSFLEKVYAGDQTCKISDLSEDEMLEMAKNLSKGVPFATPIFDGANEKEIERMLTLADLPANGQVTLYDGRSGEPFARQVTVGLMYIMKLHHLVDEKMHSRSTGPYSLITQQPLGGKAQRGGQRFGEMEVWALEAYGAAHALCEMLTIKSDDVGWRGRMFEDIASGDYQLKSGVPESFNVLMQELRAMCIDMDFETE